MICINGKKLQSKFVLLENIFNLLEPQKNIFDLGYSEKI